ALLNLCLILATLRSLAKKTWGKQVEAMGLHVRVASRYVKIGQSPLAQIGPNGSDSIARLPADIKKLEACCRLNPEPFEVLLKQLDPRQAPRDEVIAAVQKIRGKKKSSAKLDDEKKIEKTIDRFVELAMQLRTKMQTEPDKDRVNKINKLLADGLHR